MDSAYRVVFASSRKTVADVFYSSSRCLFMIRMHDYLCLLSIVDLSLNSCGWISQMFGTFSKSDAVAEKQVEAKEVVEIHSPLQAAVTK